MPRGFTWMPWFANEPYAETISSKVTSDEPSASVRFGTSGLATPSFCAIAMTFSGPIASHRRTATTFKDFDSAYARVTFSLVYLPPKLPGLHHFWLPGSHFEYGVSGNVRDGVQPAFTAAAYTN